uniref:Uncharacterized protein n=2 Tax=Chrysotila carterae TaxID=13221 RepID=A0A6S9QCU7_CHRCT
MQDVPSTPSVGSEVAALWRSPEWRSLRGQRFGYCHSKLHLLQSEVELLEAPRDLLARGSDGPNERGAPLFCSALIAWRCLGSQSRKAPNACVKRFDRKQYHFSCMVH